ncbi:MAG TPA: hypothetical protein VF658_21435 [Pyrinomonadaceae bacterium]|jgi:hypothetical protein
MALEKEQVPQLGHEDEEMLRHYLLGGLSEVARQQVDERLFADNDYFQHLLLVEEELVDDYVSGSLSEDEEEKFDQYFLTNPERVEAVAFARSMGSYIEKRRGRSLPASSGKTQRGVAPWKVFQSFLPSARPAFAWPLLAALVLLVIGMSWVLIQFTRRTTPSEPLQANQAVPLEQPQQQMTPSVGEQSPVGTQPSPPAPGQTPTPETQQPKVAQAPTPKTSGETRPPDSSKRPRQTSVQSVFLATGLIRGEDDTTLVKVPSEGGSVVFNLALTGDVHPSYRAVLIKGEREVRSWPTARAVSNKSGKFVPLTARVKNLSEGSYYILLSGVTPDTGWQEIGRYYFRLAKD